jgi:hypothetical protein
MNASCALSHHSVVVLYRAFGDLDLAETWPVPALEMSPQEALRLLRERASHLGVTVSRLLLDTKGGGVVARAEIFRWLGEPVEMAPHTCTCRTCGRTFR